MKHIEIYTVPPKNFKFDTHVSACYLIHQNLYLFLKKNNLLKEETFWTVPAGKMEIEESPRDAVIREVFEETGISLQFQSLKKMGQLYIRKPKTDFAFYLFRTELNHKPKICLSNEHSHYQWISAHNIPSLHLMPGGKEAFEYFQKFQTQDQLRKVFLACHLLLRKDDKYLFSLRKNTGHADGQYGLISGHVEGGEAAKLGMVRETREEINIEIDPSDLKLVHTMHHRSNVDYIHFFFECSQWKGEIENLEPHKCESLDFFSLKRLPNTVIPYIKTVINKILNNENYSEEGYYSVS